MLRFTAVTSGTWGQVLVRIALCLIAVVVQYLLVPSWYSWKPLLTLVLFAILMIVRLQSSHQMSPLAPLSARAVILFLLLHALLFMVAFHYSPIMARVVQTPGLPTSLVAVSKLLILSPILALFPMTRTFLREISAEAIAACIALFTFDPDRFFALIWPAYSWIVGVVIAAVSRLFVPGTHLTGAVDGVLVVGPVADMFVGVSCSGIKSIVLFQVVFTIIIIAEWNHINKLRAAFFYAAACAALLFANIVRLAIVYLTLNLTSNVIDLSWPLFVLTFLALGWLTRDWMLAPQDVSYRTTALS